MHPAGLACWPVLLSSAEPFEHPEIMPWTARTRYTQVTDSSDDSLQNLSKYNPELGCSHSDALADIVPIAFEQCRASLSLGYAC